jgi:hypothetical protein
VFLILLAVLMGAIKCSTADLPPFVFYHLVTSRSHPGTRYEYLLQHEHISLL